LSYLFIHWKEPSYDEGKWELERLLMLSEFLLSLFVGEEGLLQPFVSLERDKGLDRFAIKDDKDYHLVRVSCCKMMSLALPSMSYRWGFPAWEDILLRNNGVSLPL
jgi:hypothetical protein